MHACIYAAVCARARAVGRTGATHEDDGGTRGRTVDSAGVNGAWWLCPRREKWKREREREKYNVSAEAELGGAALAGL